MADFPQKTLEWQLRSTPGGMAVRLPGRSGTLPPQGIDMRTLHRQSGLVSFDPGFGSTASCESALTYIDGERGELLHRGYPVEQLCQHKTYPEVAWLLLHGELPDAATLDRFNSDLSREAFLHEQVRNFFNGFRRDSHPMAMLCGTLAALSSFHGDQTADQRHRVTAEERDLRALQLIAKMPTLAAWAYRYGRGLPLIYPSAELPYAGNMLHMLFSMPGREWKPNPVLVRAFDRIMTLHIDHGQNVSTSTVRMAGSSGVNPFACVAAGVAALWGPAHGGANEAVLDMLDEIGTVERIPAYMARVRDRADPTRLMGFGHRIYRSKDPRAALMRAICHEVLDELGARNDPHLALAMELERIALEDDYFVNRKLYPNVDFYSGIILRAMGIPSSMFTVFFAVARTAGWVAQWKEMVESGAGIARPRQIYTGPARRDVPPSAPRTGVQS
ncbi:citrate synthase [Formicincola oecophyllae]|uniref:Citrate synthase n=1 Tax=Formicincola oecophyllae TaxID=2558361 RepID=A0A4Y6UBA3_9PROT|nr:citrate synthase [Formicincola oecophyllae]QDH13395.1 citrate synthase [Formicincola oecophyllae]